MPSNRRIHRVRPTAAWRWDMKAICLRARGGPEALAYEEAPQPHPGEGEVLVRVHAAGVIHTELSWVPTWAWGTWCTDSMTGTGTAPRPNTAWRASPISPTSRPASITFTQPPHRFPL